MKAYYLENAESVYKVQDFTWTTFYGSETPASYVYAGAYVWQGYLIKFGDGDIVSGQNFSYTLTSTGLRKYKLTSVTGGKHTYNSTVSSSLDIENAPTCYTYDNVFVSANAAFDGSFTLSSFAGVGATSTDNYDFTSAVMSQDLVVARKSVSGYTWTMSDGSTSSTSVFTQTYNRNDWTLTASIAASVYYDTVMASDGKVIHGTVAGGSIEVNGSTNSTLLTNNVRKDAGSYTASIAAGDDESGYYTLTAASQAYTISKVTLTMSSWTVGDLVYNATAQNGATTSFTNVVSGDTVLPQYTYTATSGSLTGDAAKNVGTYTTTVGITSAAAVNYQLPGSGLTSSAWQITAKNVTVTWSNADGYTGTYKRADQGVTASLDKTGTAGTEAADLVYSTDALLVNLSLDDNTKTNAGNYTATATLTGDASGNYVISSGATHAWSIARKALTVAPHGYVNGEGTDAGNMLASLGGSVVYDGYEHGLYIYVTGVISGDTVSVPVTYVATTGSSTVTTTNTEFSATAVGDYSVTWAVGDIGDNYYVSSGATRSWHITLRPITFTWAYTSGVTNTSHFAYDGAAHGVTVSVSGILAADTAVTIGYNTSIGVTKSGNAFTATDVAVSGSTVSAYTVVANELSGTNSENYEFVTSAGHPLETTFTIDPIVISGITVANKTYDQTTSATISGYEDELLTGDDLGITAAFATAAAGNGKTVNYSFTNTNYTLTANSSVLSGSTTANITQKVLDVAWTNNGEIYTYNKSAQGVSVSVEGVLDGDTVTIVYDLASGVTHSGNAFTAINASASAYTVTMESLSGAEAGNYALPNSGTSASFTINKKSVALTWSAEDNTTPTANVAGGTSPDFVVTYNGKTWTMSASATTGVAVGSSDAGVYTSDSLDLTVSSGAYTGTNASSTPYSVTVTAGNTNYTVTNATATLTINKRVIATSFSSESSFVYDKSTHGVTLSVSNVIAGDAVTVNTTHTGLTGTDIALTSTATDSTTYTASTVGNYTVNIAANDLSGADAGNYTVAANSKSFSIITKGITVTAISSKVYDGLMSFSGDIIFSGVCAGDETALSESAVYADDANANIGAQMKNVTVTIVNANYSVNGVDGGSAQSYTYALGVITPKTVTVTVTPAANFTYDATTHNLFTATISGLVGEQTLTFKYTYGEATNQSYLKANDAVGSVVKSGKDAGTYTLTFTGLADGTGVNAGLATNYSLSASAAQSVTINKKEVSVTWDETTYVYDGTDRTVTPSLTSGATSASDYKIYADDADYVSLDADENVKVNVGSYTATADLTTGLSGDRSGNYTIVSGASNAWTITARPISVVVGYTTGVKNTNQFTYSNSEHGVTLTFSNVVSGDTVTVSFAENDINVFEITSTGYTQSYVKTYQETDAGSYTITITGVDDSNYSITEAAYSFTVLTRAITVTAASSKPYDGTTDFSGTLTFDNIADGETVEDLHVGTVTYGNKNVGTSKTMTVPINNANYTLGNEGTVQQSGDFNVGVINKKPISVSWTNDGETYTYNNTAQGITLSLSDIVNGESVTVTLTGTNITPEAFTTTAYAGVAQSKNYTATDAKYYSVTIASVDDSNYSIALESASWTIGQKSITVVWDYNSAAKPVYNNTTKTVTPSFLGNDGANGVSNDGKVIAADAANVSLVATSNTGVNAGDYSASVSLSGTRSDNYTISAGETLAWTIDKAEISWVTIADSYTVVYDSAPHTLGVTTGVNPNNDDAEITISAARYYSDATYETEIQNLEAPVNVGTYYVVVTVTAGDNYNVKTLGGAEHERHITITTRYLRIVWANSDTFTGVYNGTDQGRVATVIGIQGSDVLTFTSNSLTSGATMSVSGNEISFLARNALASGSYTGYFGANIENALWSNYAWQTEDYIVDEEGTYILDGTTYTLLSNYTKYSDAEGTVENSEGAYIRLSDDSVVAIASLDTYTRHNYSDVAERTATWTIAKKTLTFSLSGETSYDYNAADQGATFVIEGLVNGESLTFTYTFMGTGSVSGLKVNGTEVTNNSTSKTVTVTDDFTFTGLNASSYTIMVTNVANGTADLGNYDYTTPFFGKSFSINKKQLTINWIIQDSSETLATSAETTASYYTTYNGKTWSVTASLVGVCTGDTVTMGSVAFNDTAKNADHYTATATLTSGTANYEIDTAYATCYFEIKPIEVSFTWMYDGIEDNENWSGSIHGFDGDTHTITAAAAETYVAGEELSFTYTGNSARNVNRASVNDPVGNYVATIVNILVNGVSSNNYVVTSPSLVWTITPAAINGGDANDVVIQIDPTIEYDASAHPASLNKTISRFNDELTYSFTYTTIGQYVVDANGNYASNDGITFYGFSPTKYAYDYVEELGDYGYYEDEDGTYYYLEGYASNDGYILITEFNAESYDRYRILADSNPRINVGSYSVYVTLSGVNYETLVTEAIAFAITPTEIDGLSLSDDTVTYDKAAHTLDVADANAVAGTHYTQYYTEETTAFGSAQVITYTKYIEAENGAYVYYEGELVEYIAQEGTRYDVFPNENVTGINAGTYSLLIIADAGDNYNRKYMTATLTIERKVLTPVWTVTDGASNTGLSNTNSDGVTWTTTYNGNAWTMTAAVSAGICTNDTVTIAAFASGSNVFTSAGSYQVTATLSGADAANYVLDEAATATLAIAKRAVTINWTPYNASGSALTAVGGSVAYDKIAHGVTVTIGNLVSGETVNFTCTTNVETSGGATFTSAANSANYYAINVLIDNGNVVSYTVSFTEVNDDNYDFTASSASFTIAKANIISSADIYANSVTTTYDKTVKTLTMGHTGALSDGLTRYEDAFTATFSYYSDAGRTTEVTTPMNAGTYYGSVTLTAGTNYNDVTLVLDGTGSGLILTINKATIANVTLVNDSAQYNGYSHASEIIVTNENASGMTQYDDEIVEVVYSYYTDNDRLASVTAENVKNARKYYTKAVVSAGDNYNDLTLLAEYEITPKSVTLSESYTVTPDRDNRIHYNGNDTGFTLSLTGLVGGESLVLNATYTEGVDRGTAAYVNRFTAKNVGTYTVTITPADNGTYLASNYLLTGGNMKTFVITPVTISAEWVDLSEDDLTITAGVAQFYYTRETQGVMLSGFTYTNEDGTTVSAPSDIYLVTFNYNNASAIDVAVDGSRNAISRTASVTGILLNGEATDNYLLDQDYELDWIIKKATSLSGLTFTGATYVYNTNSHSIGVTGSTAYGESAESLGFTYNIYVEAASGAYVIVSGAPVAYDGSDLTHASLTRYTKVTGSNEATNAGVYKIEVADIESNNYEFWSGLASGNSFDVATLTINQAAITGLNFTNLTVTYDGAEHLIIVASESETGGYVLVNGAYVAYNEALHTGMTRYAIVPVTQYGEAISVTYAISEADAGVSNNNDRTHGAKNVLKVGNTVTGRQVTAIIDAGSNYVALTGETALTAILTVTPVEVGVVWKSYADHSTALTLNSGVAQFTYNMAAQGVYAVLSSGASIFSTETPVAVYDTSAENLGNSAVDVYRVSNVVTAKTATIVGFTVGGNATDNYALASGAESSQNWIINPAYAYYTSGTNGLFYLNNGTHDYDGTAWFLNLVATNVASGVSSTAVTSYEVKTTTAAYNAATRSATSGVSTENLTVVYYYTTDSTLTFNVANLSGWTNMEDGVTDAGTYYIVAVIEDNNYETFVSTKSTLTISPFVVTTITWSYGSYVYNGTDRSASVTASFVGPEAVGTVYLTEDIHFEKNGSAVIFLNADSYTAVIDTEGYTNYDFTNANVEQAITIAPAALTIVWNNSANWSGTYYKTAQGKIATIQGLVGAEVLTFNWRFVMSGASEQNGNTSATEISFLATNAGTHRATITGKSNYNGALASNYVWSTLYVEDENGTYKEENGVYTLISGEYEGTRYSVGDFLSFDIVIAKKQIDVVWGWTNAGGASSLVYNKNDFVWSVSCDTQATLSSAADGKVCYGDTVTFAYTDETGMLAGDYTSSVLSNNGNYEVSEATATNDWTILPKTVTVKSASLAKTYDGTAVKELTVSDLNGVETGDVITATMTYDSRHIGTHDATFELDGDDKDNYTILDLTGGEASITAYSGTALTWSGDSVVYNGYEQTVQATIALLGDDRVDYAGGSDSIIILASITQSSSAATYKNAGSYTATADRPVAIAAADWTQLLADYGISVGSLSVTATIARYDVEGITWTGDGNSYYYNNTDQHASITAGFDLLGNDVGTITPTITKGGVAASFINAGTYVFTIDPNNLGSEPFWSNYNVGNVTSEDLTRTIVMNKASLDNYLLFTGVDNWTYSDGTAHAYYVKQLSYTVAAEGAYLLVNGNYLVYEDLVRYSEDPENAGEYALDPSGTYIVVNGAYALISGYARYNIVAETFASTESTIDLPYEDPAVAIAFTYNGGDVSGYPNKVRNAGTYTITASYAGNANYEAWTDSVTVTVARGDADFHFLDDKGANTIDVTYQGSDYALYASPETGDYYYEESVGGKYVAWTIEGTVYYVDYTAITRYSNEACTEAYVAEDGAYVSIADTAVSYAELAAGTKYIRMENYLNSRALNYLDGSNANIYYEIWDGSTRIITDEEGTWWKLNNEDIYIAVTDVRWIYDSENEIYVEDENGGYIRFGDAYYAVAEVDTTVTYRIEDNWVSGNSAKDVLKTGDVTGSYAIRATIAQTANYNAWTMVGYLRINPFDTSIVYMSAGVPVDVVYFEYCGVDQAPYLNAYITALGGDGTISTDGTGNKIWLDLQVYAADDLETELDEFKVAGDYRLVAAWYPREVVVADSSEEYADAYARYINNYNVTNYYLEVTMHKRSAQISWFIDDEYTTVYDDTAFVYDGTDHIVYARGTTIQVAEQDNANGTNVYQNGTLTSYNAGTHGMHIQLYTRSSNVYTLKELTAVDGNYFFYSTNGSSFTAITSENIESLTENDSYIYYKDGDNYYRANTLYVYNPIFRRFVAYAGDFGPFAANYGFNIQKYGTAHYDTIAITVNTNGTYESDATTQRQAGRYLSTIQDITGAGEGILQNYDVNASILSLSWVISERVIDVVLDGSVSKVYDGDTDMKGTETITRSAAAGTVTYTYTKGEETYDIIFSNILAADVNNDFLTDFTVTADSKDVTGCTEADIYLVFAHNTNYIYKVRVGESAGSFANYEASFTPSVTGLYVPDDRVARDGDPLHKFYRIYNENAHNAFVPSVSGDYVYAEHYVLLSSLARYSNAACTTLAANGEYVIFGDKKGVPYAIVAAGDKYVNDNGTYVLNNEEGTYVKYYTYELHNDDPKYSAYDRFRINRYSTLGITYTGTITASVLPRPIEVTWTYDDTLVYDRTAQEGATATITNLVGQETVAMTFGYTGTANVTGAYDSASVPTGAGTYATTITSLSDTNYTTVGGTALTSESWSIAKLDVVVDYNNFVQSWQGSTWVTPTTVTVVGTDAAEINALIAADELTFIVTLKDKATARSAAANLIVNYFVNDANEVIEITLNDNYAITSDRIFTVSALTVSSNNAYTFNVTSVADIAVLAGESEALHGIGVDTATYTQTADISGAATVYENAVVTKLYGNYVGTGSTLSDFMIVGNGAKVGFFGEVTGTITGVDLRFVTVISTGANAKVGSIAAVANGMVDSSAQGYVYVGNDSTVGFLAGETDGVITGSTAVGYVKVFGGTVTVGGAVGSANANVTANTFVEVNKIATATVAAGGIAGSVGEGEITVAGAYLAGSLGGVNTTVANGTAKTYAEILAETENEGIIYLRDDILAAYVMRGYYVGTMQGSYTISNYRQLAIAEMFSWATYTIGADIYLPFSYGNGVHAGEFTYGAIQGVTGENAKKIYSSVSGTFMGVTEEVR